MNLIEEKNQFTPKKKRLYCNNKKVPHWAENLDVIYYLNIRKYHNIKIINKIYNKIKSLVK
jgi:hypothetical protein